MNKNFYIVGNLVYILMCKGIFGSKEPQYVACGRASELDLNSVISETELVTRYPDGQFFKTIQGC